ncbi:MAG TPA: hypothetical protein EYP85_09650 [Armatimonadetes bacterium]|nr:hypothetical protein [Armatimonadota bacterium]
MEKVRMGIEGLDEILYGGILRGGSILVEGTPGVGKTTLGMQFIHEGIVKYGEAGLIVTFEEVPVQMYRDALNFGWDLRRLSQEGKLRVIPTSPAVFQQQIDSPEGLIQRALREMDVRRIMIDSITHFQRITSDPIALRELLNRLLNLLRQGEYTTILVGEVTPSAADISFEEYVVDAVFRLSFEITPEGQSGRYLEVIKARGQDFMPGKHAVAFGPQGMMVYPTPQPKVRVLSGEGRPPLGLERISTGIAGLDDMLGGGLFRGFATLIAGEDGTGKTAVGVHFLHEGANQGEKGLFISLAEKPHKIVSLASAIGMDLRSPLESDLLTFIHRPPMGLNLNELYCQIREALADGSVRRVLFDSLADVEINITSPVRLRDFVYSLLDLFDEHQVTSIFTANVHGDVRETAQVDPHLALIMDTIVLLRYREIEGRRRKVATVLKIRGSDHDPGTRGYKITPKGVIMGPAFAVRDILMGT